jgi:hypothetical protein
MCNKTSKHLPDVKKVELLWYKLVDLEQEMWQILEPYLTQSAMEEAAAEQLISFLRRQKDRTKSDLPHRHHILIEFVHRGPGAVPGGVPACCRLTEIPAAPATASATYCFIVNYANHPTPESILARAVWAA